MAVALAKNTVKGVAALPDFLAGSVGNMADSLMTLPKRAIQAAGEYQRGGDYDPRPALETAMLMAGGRQLGPSHGESLGALTMKRKSGKSGTSGTFDLHNDAGLPVANAEILKYGPEHLYVKDVGVPTVGEESLNLAGANTLGHANMRSMIRELKKEFPEAKYVGGHRVSGGREKAFMESEEPGALPRPYVWHPMQPGLKPITGQAAEDLANALHWDWKNADLKAAYGPRAAAPPSERAEIFRNRDPNAAALYDVRAPGADRPEFPHNSLEEAAVTAYRQNLRHTMSAGYGTPDYVGEQFLLPPLPKRPP